MDGEHRNGLSTGLKRHRDPLSDSEDNVPLSFDEVSDVQKRRRLEAFGEENVTPEKRSSSGTRLGFAEFEVKPDTPAICSIRSRVQQLTQRRGGGPVLAQRCLSDPGSGSGLPSFIIQDGFKEHHLIGEAEFSSRVERFKAPITPQTSPLPANRCPRTLSNAVTNLQMKLEASDTPSSKQVSRIRQEREEELRLLRKPITENVFLKRSLSDTSLTERATSPFSSSSPRMMVRRCRRLQWPPFQPWKQADANVSGDEPVEVRDGSFTTVFARSEVQGEEPPIQDTGEVAGSSVDMDVTLQEVEVMHMTQEQEKVMCNMAVCQGHSRPEKQHGEAEAAPLEEEQDKAESLGEKQKESGSVEGEEQREVKFIMGEHSNDQTESHLDYKQVAMGSVRNGEDKEAGSTIEHEKSKMVEVFSLGQEEVATPAEEVEAPLDERLGSLLGEDERLGSLLGEEERLGSLLGVEEEEMVAPLLGEEEEKASPLLGEVEEKASPLLGEVEEKASPLLGEVEEEKAGPLLGEEEEEKAGPLLGEEEEEKAGPLLGEEEEEKAGPLLGEEEEEKAGPLLGEEEEEKAGPLLGEEEEEKAGPLLGEEEERAETLLGEEKMEFSDQVKVKSLKDVQDVVSDQGEDQREVVSHLGPEHREAANTSAQSDREQGDPELLTGEDRTGERHSEARGLKKVTFILEPEMINDSALSELDSSSRRESLSEAELDSHDETNTAEMIDLMFDEVLDAAAQRRMEEDGDEEEGAEDHDSGIATVMDRKEKTDAEFDMEKAEGDDVKETEVLESSANEELLTFPSSCILSPLSKSVEAVVTPMRLAASQPANPPFLSPEEPTSPTPDSVPLYSIDAYRTLTQSSKPATHSVTPGLLRNVAEKSQPKPSINTKERIQVLNEEAAKLQVIINQTLHALSCCTDEEHGRGSLEEAEAEKLLLVSCEKREALLSEVARLKDSGSSVSELEEGDGEQESPPSQQPCRGTISISRVQLPLKVEFVCSARTRTGRPTHYFFVLIRYGPCNIVATPLATAADAQNGDTISFPTSITLQDIRSNFEIDVEIYSLSQASGNTGSVDLRRSTKSRSTPMKLLSTRKRTNQSGTSSNMAALNTRRTSNFCLVGCHKITLASLGQNKFPLDKMKFEGKIRRLLGDEFQEKVPFLSPLEGNIYLQLESQSHSNVQHQGFLTMFEVVNGFGAWHRRFFVLEGNHLSYWNHPNDRGSKPAESCVSLSSSFSQSVKPVKRDSCARPYTFELVSSSQTEQQDDQAKGWFSADTREDLGDWMEKLNQVLLDLNTWTRCSLNHAGAQTKTSSCKIRESSL